MSSRQRVFQRRLNQTLERAARQGLARVLLLNNVRASLGAGATFRRTPFPLLHRASRDIVSLSLAPFNSGTLTSLLLLERPAVLERLAEISEPEEGPDPRCGAGVGREPFASPSRREKPSQRRLLASVSVALVELSAQIGEEELFCGAQMGQVGGDFFSLDGVFPVSDLSSALAALRWVGGDSEVSMLPSGESSYDALLRAERELACELKLDPDFEFALPAASGPWLGLVPEDEHQVLVSGEPASHVVDLGNSLYVLLLRLLAQVYAPFPLPKGFRRRLASLEPHLWTALAQVGRTAARLPLAPGSATTAGLTFQLSEEISPLVQTCAALVLAERSVELAELAEALSRRAANGPFSRAMAGWPEIVAVLRGVGSQLVHLHSDYERELRWQFERPHESAARLHSKPLSLS